MHFAGAWMSLFVVPDMTWSAVSGVAVRWVSLLVLVCGNVVWTQVAGAAGPQLTPSPGHIRCNQSIVADTGSEGEISSPNYPQNYPANVYCVYRISTPSVQQLIRVDFLEEFHIAVSLDCREHYLHIGNNLNNIDVRSLTSYQLCGHALPQQIVSRANSLWIIFSSMMTTNNTSFGDTLMSHKSNFTGFKLHYRVQPRVDCGNASQFQCSPVECVLRTQVCDGIPQCSNSLDEYCVTGSNSPAEACFLCEDGSCILPRQPFYSTERGKRWWWLCDDYDHCPDGTDESVEVCHGLESRSGSLFSCQAARQGAGVNLSVLILRQNLCDGLAHCLGARDETLPLCQVTTSLNTMRKEVIYIPLISATVFVLTMATIYYTSKIRKQRKMSRLRAKRKGSREMPETDLDADQIAPVCV